MNEKNLNGWDLQPKKASQKSFYGNARVTRQDTKTRTNYEGDTFYDTFYKLYSYNTLICTIHINYCNYVEDITEYTINCTNKELTQTTLKHLKDFLFQYLPNKIELENGEHLVFANYDILQKHNFDKKSILSNAN